MSALNKDESRKNKQYINILRKKDHMQETVPHRRYKLKVIGILR